jgi:hypothetical protein
MKAVGGELQHLDHLSIRPDLIVGFGFLEKLLALGNWTECHPLGIYAFVKASD